MRCLFSFAVLAAAVCLLPTPVNAEVITNGDFENWSGTPSKPDNWAGSSAYQTSGLNGSNTAVWMESGGYKVYQDVSGAGSNWVFDMFFAMEDPDTDSNTPDQRGLHFYLAHPNHPADSWSRIVLRVTEDGHLQVYDEVNSSPADYQTVFSGAVSFSVDGTDNDKDFTTGTDCVLNQYHLQLVGHYDQAVESDRTYDVHLSNANESTFSHHATGLRHYQNANPAQNAEVDHVCFSSDRSDGSYVVDQVSLVPEPSTIALLCSGLVLCGFGWWRRRRR